VKHIRHITLLSIAAASAALAAYWLRSRPIAADILPDQSITVDGSRRQYRLVIPHGLPASGVPVVFAFHGTGDSPGSMAAYSQWDRLAADNGFLLVYPEAVRAMWKTVNVDPDQLDQNPDVRFFDQLLIELGKRFPLDADRIYVVGMSNGASFAQLVAYARPNVAAVVAHSGTPPRELREPVRAFPLLLLVGEHDPAIDALRSTAAKYRDDGHAVEFVSVPGLGHQWSTKHNAAIWEFLSKHRGNE
jgi:poly(3-hydroxybutyrate) depolymerase